MDLFFLDLLGLLVGFVSLLFLLSLIVTGLVQATQAILRLRARNLLFGLASVLVERAGVEWPVAKEKAREILNDRSASVFRGSPDPNGIIAKIVGPRVSWLDEGKLREILSEIDMGMDTASGTCDELVEGVENIERPLSKRFLRNIRIWTILWSMAVAFAFQATPSALFFVAPQAVNVATSVPRPARGDASSTSPPPAGESKTPGAAASVALRSPDETVPDYFPSSTTPASASGDSQAAWRTLRQLGMEPFSDGSDFYFIDKVGVQWANVFGTLLTVVLLSFGAPFWFNVLNNIANLRDVLKPKKLASDGIN